MKGASNAYVDSSYSSPAPMIPKQRLSSISHKKGTNSLSSGSSMVSIISKRGDPLASKFDLTTLLQVSENLTTRQVRTLRMLSMRRGLSLLLLVRRNLWSNNSV